MTRALSTAEVARAVGLTVRRLNEWAAAGIAEPRTPAAKQGSGAEWTEQEVEVLRLLVAVKKLAVAPGLAALGRAVRRARGRPVTALVNGGVEAEPSWEPGGAARGSAIVVRLAHNRQLDLPPARGGRCAR